MTVPSHVPAELVIDFDIYDHSLTGRWHEIVEDLRTTCPVAYTERNEGHWIVTRYEDVQRVLRDAAVFSSSPPSVPRSKEKDERHKPIPVSYDAPAHTTYRDLIAPLFAPKRMRELEDGIRKFVNELIDGFEHEDGIEFVDRFARPLPSTVFLLLMGWPLEDASKLNHWSHAILTGKPGGTIEESAAVRKENIDEVYEYFAAMIADRRANPRDDFTTELINGTYGDERPLTEDELERMLSLLMMGGLHTVQGALSYGVMHFAEHPELQDRLRDDPGVMAHAVEEVLRWDPPVWPSRRTLEDVVIGGVEIKADEMILCGTTGANHDPGEFACPGEMQLDRQPNRHMTFSVGPHRCIGSHLARLEMKIAFEELHRRLPTYRLDADRPPVRHLGVVNGMRELYLTFR